MIPPPTSARRSLRLTAAALLALGVGACAEGPPYSSSSPPPSTAYTPPPTPAPAQPATVVYTPPPGPPAVTYVPAAPPYRITYVNPPQVYRAGPYSQAVVIDSPSRIVMVGGQHAVDSSGHVVGIRNVAWQTEQALANVEAALAAAGLGVNNVVKSNIYVVTGEDSSAVYDALRRRWGRYGELPATSLVMVPALARADYLVEIDATAAAPSR